MIDSTDLVRKKFCQSQYKHISELKIRDKRALFLALRLMEELDVDSFLPSVGASLGEFGVFQIISESNKRNRTEEISTTPSNNIT